VSRTPLIEKLEKSYLKKDVPLFNVGDTVCVQTRIIEGEKERVQAFTGTVIAKKGTGLSETFSLYRHAYGSNMERVFLLHSPRIAQIDVVRSGKVRRAKLYYIRGKSGKAIKVREQFVGGEMVEGATVAPSAPETPAEETPKT
jgi:large subunit ribosomal protein L19